MCYRMPLKQWLLRSKKFAGNMPLSLHLCGRWLPLTAILRDGYRVAVRAASTEDRLEWRAPGFPTGLSIELQEVFAGIEHDD